MFHTTPNYRRFTHEKSLDWFRDGLQECSIVANSMQLTAVMILWQEICSVDWVCLCVCARSRYQRFQFHLLSFSQSISNINTEFNLLPYTVSPDKQMYDLDFFCFFALPANRLIISFRIWRSQYRRKEKDDNNDDDDAEEEEAEMVDRRVCHSIFTK